jgi:cell fate (sporulation/competence/biofilm development) regulator YmcA (YheA/YmcA/DUF963 family)
MPRQSHDKPRSLIEIRITISTLSGTLDTFRQQNFQIRHEEKQHINPDKKKELIKKAVLWTSYPDRSYEKQTADTIPSGSQRSSEIYKLRCSFISRTL